MIPELEQALVDSLETPDEPSTIPRALTRISVSMKYAPIVCMSLASRTQCVELACQHVLRWLQGDAGTTARGCPS
jgi:hypothetical protein